LPFRLLTVAYLKRLLSARDNNRKFASNSYTEIAVNSVCTLDEARLLCSDTEHPTLRGQTV